MFVSDNEKELIAMIREHDDPEQAIQIAVNIILEYLTQL